MTAVMGHIVQHGCCSPEEDREVASEIEGNVFRCSNMTPPSKSGQEGLWMQETEQISHSCAMAWKSTRSAVWRTTAASWPSLAPTPSGMPDTPPTGTETVSWHPEEQAFYSHPSMYSHILIAWYFDLSQLMLCHCIGGIIPECDVILDNSSDGYSCKPFAVYWLLQ